MKRNFNESNILLGSLLDLDRENNELNKVVNSQREAMKKLEELVKLQKSVLQSSFEEGC